jgi:hypothetical protein
MTRAGMTAGVLAVPPAVGSALVAADVADWWAARGTVLAVGLVLVILALPRSPKWLATASQAYGAVVVSALVWPLVAGGTAGESGAIYAGVSLFLVALAVAMLAPEILHRPSTVESETPARGWRWEATLAIIAASIAGVALATHG